MDGTISSTALDGASDRDVAILEGLVEEGWHISAVGDKERGKLYRAERTVNARVVSVASHAASGLAAAAEKAVPAPVVGITTGVVAAGGSAAKEKTT